MRLGDRCIKCTYDKEAGRTNDEEYLGKVREILDNWDPKVSAPYYEYLFNKMYAEKFGKIESMAEIKKEYNDLVLGVEDEIRQKINESKDPLKTSLFMARIGNFIDFSAMKNVNKDEFITRLFDFTISEQDEKTYQSFCIQCETARNFLLVADNCGEIVLDRLFLEQLKKRYTHLERSVLVRGGEVSNDATMDDAVYAGVDKVANVVSSGVPVAGMIPDLMSPVALDTLMGADLIIAKGQGNFETVSDIGIHVFFSFLCKCDMFVEYFGVPRYTGMFIEKGS